KKGRGLKGCGSGCGLEGGELKELPFSLVGALHGVHLFGAAAGAELREAATPTAHLAWAGYGNSITLIALSPAPGPTGPALARILDSAFAAMVRAPPTAH
ncbi:FUZZY protein, partial [Loxia curvirostra]|nr:FUZZY protein [Loxia curvirostra]